MLLRVLELIGFILFCWLVVTQMLIPGVMNRPMFPFFRRRNLEKKLANANEQVDQAGMMHDVLDRNLEQAEEAVSQTKLTKEIKDTMDEATKESDTGKKDSGKKPNRK